MTGDVAQVFKGKGLQPWYVRLVSDNGRTLSISEGYFSKWNAKRAARRMFPDASLKDMTKVIAGASPEDAQAAKGTGSSS